jgi:hypothetical protein
VAVIQPLQDTGLKQQLAQRVSDYNDRRKEANFDTRRGLLQDVASAATRYDSTITVNPASLIGDMKQAHEHLVKYASSSGAPQDFAQLVAALETFRNNVKEIATAVEEIRDLRRGSNK